MTKFKKRLLIGVSLLAGGILYLKVISPTFGIHIPCIFLEVTGFYCPGCGMTRVTLALLDFDFYQAFRYNMLVFILTPLFLIYFLLEKKQLAKQGKVVMAVMLCLTFSFWILRNTESFNWLAPTNIG